MKTILSALTLLSLCYLPSAMAHETTDGYHQHTVHHLQKHATFLQEQGALSSKEHHQVDSDLIDALKYIDAGSYATANNYIEAIYEQERFHMHNWNASSKL
jgi:hypothetical protein